MSLDPVNTKSMPYFLQKKEKKKKKKKKKKRRRRRRKKEHARFTYRKKIITCAVILTVQI
jgi:hypothetical protein